MLTDDRLHDLAERLVAVPGVVAVLLGGSRARGQHTPDSDVDVYYRPPLDVTTLGDLAGLVAGPAAEVTEPGAWGPWVDGGAWLHVEGTAVDWIHREVDRVRASWDDAPGAAPSTPRWVTRSGSRTSPAPGEVGLGVVLAEPTGELTGLHRACEAYPGALADALDAALPRAGDLLADVRAACA